MDDEKLIREYYESKVKKIGSIEPDLNVLESEPTSFQDHKRFRIEDIFGFLVTAGYLIQFLIPEQWFSFGRFLLIYRFVF
jgi:hypothetical protein